MTDESAEMEGMSEKDKLAEFEKRYDKVEFILYDLNKRHHASSVKVKKAKELLQLSTVFSKMFNKFKQNISKAEVMESHNCIANEKNIKKKHFESATKKNE